MHAQPALQTKHTQEATDAKGVCCQCLVRMPSLQYIFVKVTLGNFCYRANKLMLAVAWDSLESKPTAEVCTSSCFIWFVVALSLFTVAGKVAAEWTAPSQLELKPTDGVTCRHSVVGRGKSEHQVRIANQLVPATPVTKKCSINQPIRTQGIESITDWANRMGGTGFLINPEYREILPSSQTTSLTPKLPTAALTFTYLTFRKRIRISPQPLPTCALQGIKTMK